MLHLQRLAISLGLILGWGGTVSASLLPVEDFAQPKAVTRVTMTRDGKYLAYSSETEDDESVFIIPTDGKGKALSIETPSYSPRLYGRIYEVGWISSKRLFIGTVSGAMAIDRDGKNGAYLTGTIRPPDSRTLGVVLLTRGILHFSTRSESDRVLLYEFDKTIRSVGWTTLQLPNVISIDTRTGAFSRELENPGQVFGWLADRDGTIRVGLRLIDRVESVIYRETNESSWRELVGLAADAFDISVLGLDETGTRLYIARRKTDGLLAVYLYDCMTGKWGPQIFASNTNDLSASDGTRVICSADYKLLGIRYETDRSRTHWFDPDMTRIQGQLDASFRGAVNSILEFSDDRQTLLVLSSSARNPGTYYILDRAKGTLSKFASVMPSIDPEKMAEMKPVEFTARDGLKLHGYLTVPSGRDSKQLPLMVMPHDGPWMRDRYGFDPDVQFLANRGYAVLQVNYRGSIGFGRGLFDKGFKTMATGIQDDIEDSVHWAISEGIADPKRIGIMGSGFGGYSALMGLTRDSALFCCGISIAGITDWPAFLKTVATRRPSNFALYTAMLGDPNTEGDLLRSASVVPRADKIRVPLLIVHGRDDPEVLYDQSRTLMKAMDKANRPYELMTKYNEAHGFRTFKSRVELYRRIEAFLAKHMPADSIKTKP